MPENEPTNAPEPVAAAEGTPEAAPEGETKPESEGEGEEPARTGDKSVGKRFVRNGILYERVVDKVGNVVDVVVAA